MAMIEPGPPKGLHPFFDRSFREHLRLTQLEDLLTLDATGTATPEAMRAYEAPVSTSSRPTDDVSSADADDTRNILDTTSPSKNANSSLGDTLASAHPNADRRKRLKLSPVAAIDSKETVNAADHPARHCDVVAVVIDTSPRTNTLQRSSPSSDLETSILKQPLPEANLAATGNGTSSIQQQQEPNSLDEKELNASVLKLNGKGALETPLSKKRPQASSEDGSTRPSAKSRKRRKHKVVILKYGTTDATRETLGNRIQQILSVAPSAQSSLPPPSKSAPTPSSKVDSSKPTHPFFLGNVTPKQQVEGPSAKSDPANEPTSPARRSANLKSFTTPGKLRQQAAIAHPEIYSELKRQKPQSFGNQQSFKIHGTISPCWPWRGVTHLPGPDVSNLESNPTSPDLPVLSIKARKQKQRAILVSPDESVLRTCVSNSRSHDQSQSLDDSIRLPERLILNGYNLQAAVIQQMSRDYQSDAAVVKLLSRLPECLTSYDNGGCESLGWAQKYAPKSATEVLQNSPEVRELRSWLRSHTVDAVDKGKELRDGASAKVDGGQWKKPRRKRAEELDGFIVSSDDEMPEMLNLEDPSKAPTRATEENEPRSIIRKEDPSSHSGSCTRANAVVLSGPHGCGKTASVYAVAKELGFEVFEINAGSRRSGKDLFHKVGDMALNHQVRRGRSDLDDNQKGDSDADELQIVPDENQRSLNSFFSQSSKPAKERKKARPLSKTVVEPTQKPKTQQKQSLILLEEVDVLFDEDRQFWEAVLEFISTSKRPLIMTCNDEALIPIEPASLHAILRMRNAPLEVAADYMLVVAASEGHLLQRESVLDLYELNSCDFRASITDLNFWCQMAVGAEAGWLDWMLQRWPPGVGIDEAGNILRVVSCGTYQQGMEWSTHQLASNCFGPGNRLLDRDVLQAATEACIDVTDVVDILNACQSPSLAHSGNATSKADNLVDLSNFEKDSSYRSCSDIVNRCQMPGRAKLHDSLDFTGSSLAENRHSNFTSGYHLLQSSTRQDYTQCGARIATALLLPLPGRHDYAPEELLVRKDPLVQALFAQDTLRKSPPLTRLDFAKAFDPLAEECAVSNIVSSELQISSFDRDFKTVVEDLAPYVRSILSYDLRLEERRLRLSSILSNGAAGALGGRRSRASRSALEGGERANTRRERWFRNSINATFVLKTGGADWPQGLTAQSSDTH